MGYAKKIKDRIAAGEQNLEEELMVAEEIDREMAAEGIKPRSSIEDATEELRVEYAMMLKGAMKKGVKPAFFNAAARKRISGEPTPQKWVKAAHDVLNIIKN